MREVDMPVPGRGEVLVRMLASPINPSDLMYITGKYGLKPAFPATPGFEGVGIVERSGGGLLGRFRTGKRVAVVNDRLGNWSDYTVTTARQVIPVPDSIPDAQAATFFVNPLTAHALTRYVLRIPSGGWLLQTAAASALGKMVVRLGRHYGFRTINVVRHEHQVDELKKLGADAVLLANGDWQKGIRESTGSEGVLYAIDPVGGMIGTQAVRSLAPGGRLITFGSLSDEAYQIEPRFLISGGQSIQGFWLGRWAKQQPILRMLRLFKRVRALQSAGVLTTESVVEYPLDQVREAVQRAKSGGTKVILRIGSR